MDILVLINHVKYAFKIVVNARIAILTVLSVRAIYYWQLTTVLRSVQLVNSITAS